MSGIIGERQACSQFGTHRATYQRGKAKSKPINTALESFAASDSRQVQRRRPRQALKANRRSPRALTAQGRAELLDAVHQERFVDRSVPVHLRHVARSKPLLRSDFYDVRRAA